MKEQIRQAIEVLKHDKRKLGAIVALLALGLLLWGRLMLKQVPRTALAKPSDKTLVAGNGGGLMRSLTRKTIEVDLPENLTRDPFQIDPSAFPKVEKPAESLPTAKSEVKPADVKPDAASLVRQAASGLALQTTILGDTPRALINGQLLAPGEKIRGFELKKVMPREVILEMNGVELRLEM
jgi:hypothetical protein